MILSGKADELIKSRAKNAKFDEKISLLSIILDRLFSYFKDCYIDEKDGDVWLSTDLPNNKESDKEYYFRKDFYLDHFIFSYDNKNDSTDTFNAYKIYSLTVDEEYFYVNIYCYSNGETYKLKSKVQ